MSLHGRRLNFPVRVAALRCSCYVHGALSILGFAVVRRQLARQTRQTKNHEFTWTQVEFSSAGCSVEMLLSWPTRRVIARICGCSSPAREANAANEEP